MRHGKRNKIRWARFAGMPLREAQTGRCSSSQGNETECHLRGSRVALEGGAQGDRSLRVRRCAGVEAQTVGASCRNFEDAHAGAGEADSKGYLRQAPGAVEESVAICLEYSIVVFWVSSILRKQFECVRVI